MAGDALRIRLADATGNPIYADKVTLKCYSSCASGLPAAAEEWDLSNLLIEGEPVQRETVVAYVNAISQHLNNEDIQQQETNPARSMTGLAQLLAFADAVGSSRGLLLAVDAQVSAANIQELVRLGDDCLELHMDTGYFYASSGCCTGITFQGRATLHKAFPERVFTMEERTLLSSQLAKPTEALMYLAYKLQLPVLQSVLQRFIKCQSCWNSSPFSAEVLQTVMSQRVVDAASAAEGSDSSSAARNALISSSSSELCSFVAEGSTRHLLRPCDLTAEQQLPITFKAEIMEDFLFYTKGQLVTAKLDLFKRGRLLLQLSNGQFVPHHVQLVLGPY